MATMSSHSLEEPVNTSTSDALAAKPRSVTTPPKTSCSSCSSPQNYKAISAHHLPLKGFSQDANMFSKFTLFPKLPLEVRLMIWRYSIPRFVRQPTKTRSYPPLFNTLKEACRVANSKHEAETLLSKLNTIIHTVDIPYFDLLDFLVAGKIRKAKEEFSVWMSTTDTVALTINMKKYTELLSSGIRRRRLIGDSVNSVIRALPLNVKIMLIILDYNASGTIGKESPISDIDSACEPHLKPLQAMISEALSLGVLLHRFVVEYKAVGKENQ
ncbi:hypothetical protein ONS95_000527 [Cadophora gregata]|uniref:uncharacterized protein n=1 Tax=Cadophora gregata TaxID=51156 RepID=UPI0026DAD12B|nr:uncharacterized protein ONS95_000527 [Cadophora gregata]KAK0125460.1 hypothetical protein ONS96_009301 [Cadophora gregata f. sp. sojae]KAK0128563.1 hypothetical protein ONS95_000527 [Cadophora gregata]